LHTTFSNRRRGQQVAGLAAAPLGETAAARADRLERLSALRAIAAQTAQLTALGQVPPARRGAPGCTQKRAPRTYLASSFDTQCV